MEAEQLRVGLLGPLEVWLGETPVPVYGDRARVVLATLALSAGQAMAVPAIAQRVWNEQQPASVHGSIASHVTRLRSVLGKSAIRTTDTGYLLDIAADQVDVLRFRRLIAQSAREQDPQVARALLATALDLWRGEPLEAVNSEFLQRDAVPALAEERLQALERRIELDLAAAAHADLLGELMALTARHPLREPLWRQLITALDACGRHADALDAYGRLRAGLREQLGVEPTAELRELFHRLLEGRAALENTAAAPAPASRNAVGALHEPTTVPHELPGDVLDFSGRVLELHDLLAAASASGSPASAAVISAIDGMPGAGKTALAIHAAHRLAADFPDGQLFIDLRDELSGPRGTDPLVALDVLLRALGVPGERIPETLTARSALWRSRLAGRRVLVILDNAVSTAQVRPLLPGSAGCLAIVTSRRRLAELDGAMHLALDILPPHDALALFTRIVGTHRAEAEPQAAAEVVRRCGYLPLAIRIAGARLTARPAWSVADLAARLEQRRRRLAELGRGDRSVEAAFGLSYEQLPAGHRRVFRLLGLHRGPDFDTYLAAAGTGLDPADTETALEDLLDVNLLRQRVPDRYEFHDLLRSYAAERAHAEESEDSREEALRRMCDFYAHTSYAADRVLHPHRPDLRPDSSAHEIHVRTFTGIPDAMAWFEAEHTNLLAAQRTAAEHGWHALVGQLAWTMSVFHARQGRRRDALAVWRAALAAAEQQPDPVRHIRALRLLGRAYGDLGRHQDALQHLNQALAMAEGHDKVAEQAHTERTLAWVWEKKGDDRPALRHAHRAFELYRSVGEPVGEADTLSMVGWHAARLGDYDNAREHCLAALALHRQRGNPTGESDTLISLGYIAHHTEHYEQAVELYEQALELLRAIGNIHQAATTLDYLGQAHAAHGDHQRARTALREALELYQSQGRVESAERVRQLLRALEIDGGGDRDGRDNGLPAAWKPLLL
jgi:DNA-binding SARP family transcriptional activator/tetratricopeptide (TPR) repeat protein